MRSLKFSLVIGLILLGNSLFAQSEKTIRNHNIKSQTVYEYFVAEGIKEPQVEKSELYDRQGNVIELKEYNKDGLLDKWQKYTYDEFNNKVEEISYDAKGKIEERIVWVYKNDLVTEKLYYDQKDRLVKKKEYKYEYQDQ